MSSDTAQRQVLPEVSLLPETASDSAVRFLRAMIFSGELRPGDRLPPERDLGFRLGISRMTLRLALKVLESSGYIFTTRGSHGGSRVSDADSLFRCWKQWMRQHSDELEDVFEFRITVEARLAALAAERRTDEDLAAMRVAVADEQPNKDWSALFRADMDVHRAIAKAARSPHLENAMMAARGELFVPVDIMHLDARQPRIHTTHEAIIEAIQAGDPIKAEAEMRRHIRIVQELTNKALQASGLLPEDKD
jgi:GntR family transcriptional repressor for pyruvate dehydrogenase complex